MCSVSIFAYHFWYNLPDHRFQYFRSLGTLLRKPSVFLQFFLFWLCVNTMCVVCLPSIFCFCLGFLPFPLYNFPVFPTCYSQYLPLLLCVSFSLGVPFKSAVLLLYGAYTHSYLELSSRYTGYCLDIKL